MFHPQETTSYGLGAEAPGWPTLGPFHRGASSDAGSQAAGLGWPKELLVVLSQLDDLEWQTLSVFIC